MCLTHYWIVKCPLLYIRRWIRAISRYIRPMRWMTKNHWITQGFCGASSLAGRLENYLAAPCSQIQNCIDLGLYINFLVGWKINTPPWLCGDFLLLGDEREQCEEDLSRTGCSRHLHREVRKGFSEGCWNKHRPPNLCARSQEASEPPSCVILCSYSWTAHF